MSVLRTASLWLWSSVAVAQTCPAPSLFDGANLRLPCVQVGAQVFSATLVQQPPGLNWRLGPNAAPAPCTPDPALCTAVGADASLTIRGLDLGGVPHRVELASGPNLTWAYRSHQPETASVLTPSVQASIRSYVQSLHSSGTVPGAVVAIVEGTRVVVIEAVGMADVAAGVAMRADTLLHIGSTNKPITALLAATLVDDGTLTLDTRVQEVLPSFSLSNPSHAARITLRQLLDMTAGLPREAGFDTSDPPRRMVDGLGNVPLVGAPGERYTYSNVSTSLAGYLVALAQQRRRTGSLTDADLNNVHPLYQAALQDRVLRPLGMTSSFLKVDDARATGRMARSHAGAAGAWTVSASVDTPIDNAAPSGGLKSTAQDMAQFVMAMMNQGLAADGRRVASAALVTQMQTLSPGPATAAGYGLSLDVNTANNGLNHIGHNGSFDNFNSAIGWFPERRVGYVLLTNGESAAITQLTSGGFLNRIADLIRGASAP